MKRVALLALGTLLSLLFWAAIAFAAERVDMVLAAARGPMGWSVGGVDVGVLLALGGVPLYATAMRWWYAHIDRSPGDAPVLPWRHALTGAVMSGGYWAFCVFLLYGLFAGDPPPGEAPSPATQVYAQEAVVAAGLIVLYAVVSCYWRRRALRRVR